MKSMVDNTRVTKMDQEEATEKTNGHRIVPGVKVKIITVTGTMVTETEIIVINTNPIIITEITIITITSETVILIITITEIIIREISTEISTETPEIMVTKAEEIFHNNPKMEMVAIMQPIIGICRITITIRGLTEEITRETVAAKIITTINIMNA